MRTLLIALLATVLSWSAPLNAEPAPAWQATDASGVNLDFPADLDKPTLLLFWATWCPYCKALMPHLQSIVDEYGPDNIQVVAVSVFEEPDGDPTAYLARQGFQFRLIDKGEAIAKQYEVHGTPGLFLIRPDGEITWWLALAQQDEGRVSGIKNHTRRAARRAPFWAAHLRRALDDLPR